MKSSVDTLNEEIENRRSGRLTGPVELPTAKAAGWTLLEIVRLRALVAQHKLENN